MRARFESLFDALRAHPDIVVMHAELLAPASEESLDRLASWAGGELGPDARALYAACDGVQLRWQWKMSPHRSERAAPIELGRIDWGSSLDDTNVALNNDGLLLLPPIATILARDWSEVISDIGLEIDGEELSDSEANAALRVFDWSSSFYLPAWLKTSGTPVRIGTDHGADWGDEAISAASYLDRIFAYAAIPRPRMKPGGVKPFATIHEALAWLDQG